MLTCAVNRSAKTWFNVALTDLIPQRNTFEPSRVVDVVANVGITSEKLLGRNRTREVALPRQVVMYLLRHEGNVSLPQIGEMIGGRDHTTVIYACEKVADMIERDGSRCCKYVNSCSEKHSQNNLTKLIHFDP